VPPSDASERINAYLLELLGGDPFAEVYEACAPHREAHTSALREGGWPDCGVYPASPQKMRLLSTLLRALGARRGLEIGGGLGYSALWLADAMGLAGQLETIDRDADHIATIDRYTEQFGLAGRIIAIHGEADDVLQRLSGPYDVIHDDGWFGEQPAYYEQMLALLRPGGVLLLANFFLLEQAVTGELTADWTVWAGPQWAENVRAYAATLASDPRLDVSFIMRPAWIGVAYKRPDA